MPAGIFQQQLTLIKSPTVYQTLDSTRPNLFSTHHHPTSIRITSPVMQFPCQADFMRVPRNWPQPVERLSAGGVDLSSAALLSFEELHALLGLRDHSAWQRPQQAAGQHPVTLNR